MRIAIDARPILKKTKTGIGIYTQNIINAFSEIDKEDQFFLYSKLRPFDRKRRLPELPAKNFFNKINYFNLPIEEKGDVCISDIWGAGDVLPCNREITNFKRLRGQNLGLRMFFNPYKPSLFANFY